MQLSTSLTADEALRDAKREFARVITPALDLVAPSSMTKEDRKTWMASAFRFLSDLPIATIEARLPMAMRSADHPAKIVSALREAGDRIVRAAGPNYEPIPDLRPAPLALVAPPLTPYEIRKTPKSIRDMGLRQGWLTQEEVDAALAQRDAA